MRSLETVTKKLSQDVDSLNAGTISSIFVVYRANSYVGQMTRAQFLEIYGHLRPGTYDVLSRRYDEAFELYFNASAANAETKTNTNNKTNTNDNAYENSDISENSEASLSISRSISPLLDNHCIHPSTNPLVHKQTNLSAHNANTNTNTTSTNKHKESNDFTSPFAPETVENISKIFQRMGLTSPTLVVLKFMKEAIEGMIHSPPLLP